MVYIFLIAAVVAVDQALKYAVVHNLGMLNSVSVIDNFFTFTVFQTMELPWEIMSGRQPVIIALHFSDYGRTVRFYHRVQKAAAPVSPVLCRADRRRRYREYHRSGASGLCGGFFEFRVWSYIFNFADICVVAGCFAVLFYVLFEGKFKGGKKHEHDF